MTQQQYSEQSLRGMGQLAAAQLILSGRGRVSYSPTAAYAGDSLEEAQRQYDAYARGTAATLEQTEQGQHQLITALSERLPATIHDGLRAARARLADATREAQAAGQRLRDHDATKTQPRGSAEIRQWAGAKAQLTGELEVYHAQVEEARQALQDAQHQQTEAIRRAYDAEWHERAAAASSVEQEAVVTIARIRKEADQKIAELEQRVNVARNALLWLRENRIEGMPGFRAPWEGPMS